MSYLLNHSVSNADERGSGSALPQKKAALTTKSYSRFESVTIEVEMKYVIAVIQPGLLDKVQDKLSDLGILGMTVSEVQGYGRQKGKTEVYRGAEYAVNFVPKIKLEVAVDDAIAEQTIEAIRETAETGKIGDGKIFILNLEEVVRIRTGEAGVDAL
jgi:nitrogen regulatory protein P-II 2